DRGLYDNFYFRPSVWIHHLVTISSFDDFKRKLKGVRNLIDYWWSRKKGH
ncbi:unnamed protein product, partial [marine sediment metagenome]